MIYAMVTVLTIAAVAAVLLAVRRVQLKKNKCARAILLIPVNEDDELFERRVKACFWEQSFEDPLCAKDIILVIMKQSANAYKARRLAQEYAQIHVVHISALSDYLRQNYNEYKNSDT